MDIQMDYEKIYYQKYKHLLLISSTMYVLLFSSFTEICWALTVFMKQLWI